MNKEHFQSYFIPLYATRHCDARTIGLTLPSNGVVRYASDDKALHLIVSAHMVGHFEHSEQSRWLKEKEGLTAIRAITQKNAEIVLNAQKMLGTYNVKLHVFNRAGHKDVYGMNEGKHARNMALLGAFQDLVRWGLERPLPSWKPLSIAHCVLCLRDKGITPTPCQRSGRPSIAGLLRLSKS